MQKYRGQFSLEIIHCDGFTSMPATAQALYFQILSVCDDEGFTSQLGICKFLSHASDEDVAILVKRRFIYQIGDDGEGNPTVTVVKHWRMNTYIHDGKRNPSTFAERELVFLNVNGNYTIDPKEGTPLKKRPNQGETECGRNVDGIKTESLQTTSPSNKRERRKEKTQYNPTQSNPIQSIAIQNNPKQNNPSASEPADAREDCGDCDDPFA